MLRTFEKKLPNMRISVFFLLFLLPLTAAFTQTDSLTFPAAWQGKYAGELQIFTQKGLVQTLPMELHLLPLDTSENYTFTIIYGEDKVAGRRSYELETVNVAKGLYRVDEKNSIIMEGYLLGDAFYQRFEVSGTLLTTITEKTGADEITWTIVSGKNEAVSKSGGQIAEGEEIPEVSAFPLTNAQRAVLRRIE